MFGDDPWVIIQHHGEVVEDVSMRRLAEAQKRLFYCSDSAVVTMRRKLDKGQEGKSGRWFHMTVIPPNANPKD